jgi:hypothetical protein
MNNWQVKDLEIDVDAVLRGQGADPEIIRSRSPRLVDIAGKALEQSLHLLEPRVLVEELEVIRFQHESLELAGGKKITGPLVPGHLVGAQSVVVAVCTIGDQIDGYASRVMEEDIVLGLAVDGVGSAAVEALANAVCRQVELNAGEKDMQTTIPLSPGMIGWSVEAGQPVVFDLVDPAQIGVSLTPYFLMTPRKTLSMIIGIGPSISSGARICDYCAMRETCRYQDHYQEAHG